jgi:hypothetical protein
MTNHVSRTDASWMEDETFTETFTRHEMSLMSAALLSDALTLRLYARGRKMSGPNLAEARKLMRDNAKRMERLAWHLDASLVGRIPPR